MQPTTNNKSPILPQQTNFHTKQLHLKISQPGFRATLTQHKRHKPYDLLNTRNSISIKNGQQPLDQAKNPSKPQYRQIMMNHGNARKDDKSLSQKPVHTFTTKKQTFKQFIRKIQMYNKNKLISQFQIAPVPNADPQIHLHNTQICIQSKPALREKLSLQMVQKPFTKHHHQTSLHQYVQNIPLQITSQQTLINKMGVKYKDKSKQFVVHESPSRGYKRSKTEQEIKIEERKKMQGQGGKQIQLNNNNNKKYPTEFSTFYITNSKQPLSHVSLKLMQYKLPQFHKLHPQSRLKTVDPSNVISRIKDKDLIKHKKLLQTKHSKIRIRFGSSLYNKNLWRMDNNNFNNYNGNAIKSKESLRKQLESICTEDLITIKYNNQKDRRQGMNSIFCEHKILQAQNAFIQKRRLVPANVMQAKDDLNKVSKRFFSQTNSFKRHKTIEYQANVDSKKKKKGENIGGWEILDDDNEGNDDDKIEGFF